MTEFVTGELWALDLGSERSERLLPGLLMTGYDVSRDGKRVAFAALDPDGKSHLWVATLDRRSSPRQLSSSSEEDQPTWGAGSDLFLRAAEGHKYFLCRMKEDGTARQKVTSEPIIDLESVSPDGEWVIATVSLSAEERYFAAVAYPTSGASPVPICDVCHARWAPDGKFLYLWFHGWGGAEVKKTFVVPVPPGKSLPRLPPSGLKTEADLARVPGVKVIEQGLVSPGPNPSVYAFPRTSVHRNLYRIPVP